jgi:hypothetical protein
MPMSTRASLVAVVGTLSITQPAAQPKARAHHWLFYDEVRQRVMLTGGTAVDSRRNFELFNDLWSFDGNTWTALPSSGQPMSGIRVALDARNRPYSFGGYTGSTIGDLRVLESNGWRQLGAHPSVIVAEGGFLFDAKRGRFITFGGGTTPARCSLTVWNTTEAAGLRARPHPRVSGDARSETCPRILAAGAARHSRRRT